MNRLIPHPLLSAALLLMWLLLNGFTLGHLVLGAVVALVAGWAMGAVEPVRLRVRRPDLIALLFVTVFWDILRSNWAVARLILTGDRHGRRRSGFVRIRLGLTNPHALAILALILTATPGTAWLEYDPGTGTLLLHVFDYLEDDDWQDLIGGRYERLLKGIFA